MNGIRLEVRSFISNKSLEKLCDKVREYLSIPLVKLEKIPFYTLKDIGPTSSEQLEELVSCFYDPITQKLYHNEVEYDSTSEPATFFIEISYRPGVTDNSANSAGEALKLLGINTAVASGALYLLFGDLKQQEAEKIGREFLANDLIQNITVYARDSFYQTDRFHNIAFPEVVLSQSIQMQEVSLDLADEDLIKLSQERCLALSLAEMKHLKAYFAEPSIQQSRQEKNLPLWPTDVEIEVLAQTWSEHCKHKIFNSQIEYQEENIPKTYHSIGNLSIDSLYKTYIKAATKEVEVERKLSWLISVFSDNAGIVRFDPKIDLCIKVETHNSPSALDPYGGALTGILGVNRDILGCGKGARPIGNTDIFCFGPPDWDATFVENNLPIGLKHPRRILEGVHLGVEDGGNKSGIPTINGAIYFDANYAGKPLVFVGTVGVLPQVLPGNISSSEKNPRKGDRIIMVGGAIGSDGIHGATFSSMELNDSAPATAVQIGDPLTQKRVMDFLIEARDLGLYSSVTDNGAGGLSSSVGEMAEDTNGASLDLALCPVKYPGLTPYELMISESQERMTLAVPPENLDTLFVVAKKHGVSATDLGEFNDGGMLSIYYGEKLVGELSLEFMHHSLPPMKLVANWNGPRQRESWISVADNKIPLEVSPLEDVLLTLLSTPNVASKESWVRRYDHEVQGATHIKPFGGKTAEGPGDSGVLWLAPHGGEKENGVAVSCGMAPRISLFDPYLMAQFAVDEALRNVLASGGNPDKCCILDNFCWPDPVKSLQNQDGDYKLGQLVRTCVGLYDICKSYGLPLVSGKDSMKNDFRGKNKKGKPITISILPTLLVTAMAQTTMNQTVTTDFKNEGDIIYLLGNEGIGLAGSEVAEHYQCEAELNAMVPSINLEQNRKCYQTLFAAFQEGFIASCHDVSDGGFLVSVVESMVGGDLGVALDVKPERLQNFLFNEAPGRFIVSVPLEKQSKFESHFESIEKTVLGTVTASKDLIVSFEEKEILNLSLAKVLTSWKKEF